MTSTYYRESTQSLSKDDATLSSPVDKGPVGPTKIPRPLGHPENTHPIEEREYHNRIGDIHSSGIVNQLQSGWRYRINQQWEAYVIEIREETFLAQLTDSLLGEDLDEDSDTFAEIYLEEVKESERYLIQPGATFYWSIGYLDKPSGRERVSRIKFRLQPPWTPEELEAANAQAIEIRELFNGE